MNVCFLLGGFTGVGGIGRVTSILANEISKDSKFNLYTLSFFDNSKPNLYNLNEKITHSYLFKKPINMTKAILNNGIMKLKRYLIENDIDILIACGALYYPMGIFSIKGIKTKIICWEHSNVQNSKDHSFQLLCRRIGAKKSDRVVTLTQHDKNSYIDKYNTATVEQIYNPIDETIFDYVKQYNNKTNKIISVGRLSYQKNFENLIEVARQVFINNPTWTWDIYGEGELRDDLEMKIKDSNLSEHVFLKGKVNNLYELYNDYSFLVMTSRYEGFPMTLLEGLAHGLPLISYNILTGPDEIIEDNINGYLIEPFNINNMSNKVEYLIKNTDVRIKMAKNNLNMCEQFKLDEIIKQWKYLLNTLCI